MAKLLLRRAKAPEEPPPVKKLLKKREEPPSVPKPRGKPIKKRVETPPPPPPPMPVKLVGKRDPSPRYSDCLLVDPDTIDHPLIVKLHPDRRLPNTYLRWKRKDRQVQCLVTVMPDGLNAAWDNCGYCMSYFRACRCKDGITPPRSIEYIYDWMVARKAGEEWDLNHPNYRGSLSRTQRERHQDGARDVIYPARMVDPALPGTSPVSGRRRPLLPVPGQPKKRIITKRDRAVVSAVGIESIDLGTVNTAAKDRSDKLTAQMEAALNGATTKKRIRKRVVSEPVKKILKRR